MKFTTLPTRIAFALLAGFVGVAAARPALAQDGEPTRTQDARPDPAPSRDDVKARWQKMSPQERKRVQESYARWKKLSDDDKDKLRQRHARLDDARRSTRDLLSDDERARLEKLKDDDRRTELTHRTKKALRERYDRLPPDLKEGVERELRDAPPRERAERVRRYLEQKVPERMRQALNRRVDRGELSRDDVDALTKRTKGASKLERMRQLREFVLAHPETFRVEPELRRRLRERASGDAQLQNDVRLLDQIQRRARKNGTVPPPRPRGGRDDPAKPDGEKKRN